MNNNWKKILIPPTHSIQEALTVIDRGSLRLALVVDGGENLLGAVTDGDIRRALIAGKDLNISISEVMSTSPIVADVDTPREVMLNLMDENELLSLPILDNGKVVGLETLYHAIHKERHDNIVFLMAGGFGTRLQPLTDNCPKPLLKVGDKPILETVLLGFIRAGFHNFYISTHYLPEMIRDHFGDGSKWKVSINYVHESEPLGTGGALGLLSDDLPDLPIIIMNGDVLTKVDFDDLLGFHVRNSAQATMCVREYEYQIPFGVIESDGHQVKGMVEKPTHTFNVNAGIYVVNKDIVESVKPHERIDMPSLLERYINNKVLMYPLHEYWLDIGRMDDFKKAQNDIYLFGLN